MNTKKKILMALALVGCAILLVVGSVAVTMAYLTSTATVTNTFTVGNVTITMDETDVDEYGDAIAGNARVTENEYKLIPGHTYTKDPIIHVASGSEVCYLFVKVENGISTIDGGSINAQLTTNGWTLVTGETNVWCKADAVDARNAAQDVAVFETFTIANDAEFNFSVDENGIADVNVTVIGYAVQKGNFDNAKAAWDATFGAP